MLHRERGYLRYDTDDPRALGPAGNLQRDGFVVLRGVFGAGEIAEIKHDVERVFDEYPPDIRRPDFGDDFWTDFRYEMLNRSPVVQRLVSDARLLDVVQPLLGHDCHVIANTAWRNPAGAESAHGGGRWHMDAGPHIPRPPGVAWDDRVPYPVFAIATHVLLEAMPLESGPTGVIAGSHKSGQVPPRDRLTDVGLEWEGEGVTPLVADAGDVAMFVSDIWHRRLPTLDGDPGRFFVQIHYGRRDIAQRIRPTAEVNHLSPDAVERAIESGNGTVVGLHKPFFYDG